MQILSLSVMSKASLNFCSVEAESSHCLVTLGSSSFEIDFADSGILMALGGWKEWRGCERLSWRERIAQVK